jgi:hypothetical protein
MNSDYIEDTIVKMITVMIKCLRLSFGCLLYFFLASACSDDVAPKNHITSFSLEKGNYWIYRWYEEFSGKRNEIAGYDSMVVVGDTLVNDVHYAKVNNYRSSELKSVHFLRDSLGTLVEGVLPTHTGIFNGDDPIDPSTVTLHKVIRFSVNKEEFINTNANTTEIINKGKQVKVPAGRFTTTTILNTRKDMISPWVGPFYYSRFYTNNVGLVKFESKVDKGVEGGIHKNGYELVRYSVK